MEIGLHGRHALVGGASQGIGRATALMLARQGAEVSLLARTAAKLHTVAEEALEAGAPRAHVVVADLDDHVSLEEAIHGWRESAGPAHIWIHNTGGPPSGPLAEADPAALQAALHRHVVAGQLLLRHLLPGMVEANWGRIVTITSTSVREPIPGLGVSNVTRAAVHAWVKSLSRELPAGITINNVLPGYTDTPRLRSLAEAVARRQGRPVERVWEDWIGRVPAGRIAAPDEVAGVVAFLCTEAAAFVHGTALPVDGGRLRAL
jgi:3-oxoacyl-[acyl-carrier protein] reductase